MAKQQQNSKQATIVLVIGVMVLCMMYIIHQSHYPTGGESKYEADLKQYTEALNEATKLVTKLKTLAAGDVTDSLEAKTVPFPVLDRHDGIPVNSAKESKVTVDPTVVKIKDLVVGMAQDTDPKNLAVFCGSLRQQNTIADVVLFINTPIAAQIKEITQKYKIITVPFNLQRLTTDVLNPSAISQSLQKYHPSTTRWSLIYNYLIVRNYIYIYTLNIYIYLYLIYIYLYLIYIFILTYIYIYT